MVSMQSMMIMCDMIYFLKCFYDYMYQYAYEFEWDKTYVCNYN